MSRLSSLMSYVGIPGGVAAAVYGSVDNVGFQCGVEKAIKFGGRVVQSIETDGKSVISTVSSGLQSILSYLPECGQVTTALGNGGEPLRSTGFRFGRLLNAVSLGSLVLTPLIESTVNGIVRTIAFGRCESKNKTLKDRLIVEADPSLVQKEASRRRDELIKAAQDYKKLADRSIISWSGLFKCALTVAPAVFLVSPAGTSVAASMAAAGLIMRLGNHFFEAGRNHSMAQALLKEANVFETLAANAPESVFIKRKNAELKHRNTKLERTNVDLENKVVVLKNRENKLKEENNQLNYKGIRVDELEHKNIKLERTNAGLKDQNKEIKDKNKEFEDQNKELKGQNKELEDQNKEIKDKNQEIKDQNKELKGQNKELEDQRNDLEHRNAKLQQNVQAAKAELEHERDQWAKDKKENIDWIKEERESLETNLANEEAAKLELQKKLEELQKKLEELQAKLYSIKARKKAKKKKQQKSRQRDDKSLAEESIEPTSNPTAQGGWFSNSGFSEYFINS